MGGMSTHKESHDLALVIASEPDAANKLYDYEMARVAGTVIAAGYRKPRTVSTAEELDALPKRTLIRAVTSRNPKFGDVFERFLSGWLHLDPSDREDGESTTTSADVLQWFGSQSVTVLYEPDAS